ncbi:MAG: Ppx/GppA family phosphatase [Methylobacteriaceae bacterium]|nr:Ppx/GppA family phosphatase [Methylobacteriaceae bacterium]
MQARTRPWRSCTPRCSLRLPSAKPWHPGPGIATLRAAPGPAAARRPRLRRKELGRVDATNAIGPWPAHGEALQAGAARSARSVATYAALDLGTNNCRLLVARPSHDGFRIVDAFSRIVRLGEGLSQTGRLSEAAIARTLAALSICRDKMAARGVSRARLVATEACRSAENGTAFVAQVSDRLGLQLEIVDRETEAHLAAAGCASLADGRAAGIVLFDIGGGSSEIVWLCRHGRPPPGMTDGTMRARIRAWASLPLGVVTLAERFGGRDVSAETFDAMLAEVSGRLANFVAVTRRETRCEWFHLLGTSGTVTTIAGVHLSLPRYDRRRVDGLWMSDAHVTAAIGRLRAMSYAERAANPCIGPDRADLVLAGCAIFEAIRRLFPSPRIRIADRGLREGILTELMSADGVLRHRHGSGRTPDGRWHEKAWR